MNIVVNDPKIPEIIRQVHNIVSQHPSLTRRNLEFADIKVILEELDTKIPQHHLNFINMNVIDIVGRFVSMDETIMILNWNKNDSNGLRLVVQQKRLFHHIFGM